MFTFDIVDQIYAPLPPRDGVATYLIYTDFIAKSDIASIRIGTNVTSFSNSVFSQCSALQSVTIPDSVTSISEYAFFDCSALQSVTIPDSVTSIGFFAFQYCSALQYVTIGDSVTITVTMHSTELI